MSLKDTPPKKAAVICKKSKTPETTVETVETVVAAAHVRGADWPQAATVTVGQPISAC